MSFAAKLAREAEKEFEFDDADYRFISEIIHGKAGIVLNVNKKNMVYSRLARRLRELRLSTFSDYCALLRSDGGTVEMGFLINALTTNLTKFFREAHHFDHLVQTAMPEFEAKAAKTGEKRLRVWSAGCSSGEEPYSIAIALRQGFPRLGSWDARILATDLDTSMVAKAREGVYGREAIADLPANTLARSFTRLQNKGGAMCVIEEIKQLIAFKQLNLLDHWPMTGKFDVIFCRNVMIYFDEPTRDKLIKRFHELLKPGGWLYIGHSETLLDRHSNFTLTGRTTYFKSAE